MTYITFDKLESFEKKSYYMYNVVNNFMFLQLFSTRYSYTHSFNHFFYNIDILYC